MFATRNSWHRSPNGAIGQKTFGAPLLRCSDWRPCFAAGSPWRSATTSKRCRDRVLRRSDEAQRANRCEPGLPNMCVFGSTGFQWSIYTYKNGMFPCCCLFCSMSTMSQYVFCVRRLQDLIRGEFEVLRRSIITFQWHIYGFGTTG